MDGGPGGAGADSIDCNSETHKWWTSYATLCLLIYPIGVPAAFATLLYWHRRQIRDLEISDEAVGAARKEIKLAQTKVVALLHSSAVRDAQAANETEISDSALTKGYLSDLRRELSIQCRALNGEVQMIKFLFDSYKASELVGAWQVCSRST